MNLPHLQTQPQTQPPATLGPKSLRALAGGNQMPARRQTTSVTPMPFNRAFEEFAQRPSPSVAWRKLEFYRRDLLKTDYDELLEIAMALSPEINKGYHDFLRFGNPGMVIDGDERAVAGAKEFMAHIGNYYGSFSLHIDSVWSGIFIGGAVFMELVLDKGGRAPLDLPAIDPGLAKFKRVYDPDRHWFWQLGQDDGFGGHKPLDAARLVKYLGFDRFLTNPYGRPMVGPAVHSSLFLLGLIQDLRRVIANHGLSRLDYSIEAEELLRLIDRNPDIVGDDEATAQFIDNHILSVREALSSLEPDDDYVHLSTVQVNYATSPIQTNMAGIIDIITELKLNVVNGYKGVASLANILDSTTETHGNLQVDYLVSAIQSTQEELAEVLKFFLDCSNHVRGIPSDLMVAFKRQRAYDRKQFAEYTQIETDTVIKKLDAGIINEVEAREEIEDLKDDLMV